MATFPVTLGEKTFASLDDLVTHVEQRARNPMPENPADGHPANWYKRRTADDASGRPQQEALWEAATTIMKRSDDTRELELAGALCTLCQHEPFFEALLDRFDGKPRPLPNDPQLRQTLADLGLQGFAAKHPALGQRFEALYEREGFHLRRLSLLMDRNPGGDLLPVLQQVVAADALPPSTAMRLAWVVVDDHPGEILDYARALAPLSEPHRQTYLDEVKDSEPGWFAQHEQALRQALRL